jgi:hypothetical protein
MKKFLLTLIFILSSTVLLFGQKTFENKQFEFSIQQPKDWLVNENVNINNQFENLKLSKDAAQLLLKNSQGLVSLIEFVKNDANFKGGVYTKIGVDVRENPARNFAQFKDAMVKGAKNLKNLFDEFELIEEPKEVEVSGIKSIAFAGKFKVRTQGGGGFKVRNRVLAIPYKSYFFQIGIIEGELEDNSKLFEDLIKTIKIGN